jgi:outer membrane lipoprotein
LRLLKQYNMVLPGLAMKNEEQCLTGLVFRCDNFIMKKAFLMCTALLVLAACSPVLSRDVMKEGAREFSLNYLRETPEVFQGKLFILGGLIVETRLTEKGSQIEALSVPVDSYGHLDISAQSQGRFFAVFPRSKGLLDPMVYRRGREITLAAEFAAVRKGKIDEMEYVYPVFEVREIYLWEDRREYYGPYYYYPYYDPFYRSPFPYDPWGWP